MPEIEGKLTVPVIEINKDIELELGVSVLNQNDSLQTSINETQVNYVINKTKSKIIRN